MSVHKGGHTDNTYVVPKVGEVYSWTGTSQLANVYIPSNLADKIGHIWHHVSQNLRWTVEKHGIDRSNDN